MHAIVHGADIQDRDGGVLLMATLFGLYPFLLKLYADGGYQGEQFKTALKKVVSGLNVEIVKRSDQAKGFVVLPSDGSSSARSPGSVDAAGSPRTGSASTAKRSLSSSSPPSASCCESYAIPHDLSGQTLRSKLCLDWPRISFRNMRIGLGTPESLIQSNHTPTEILHNPEQSYITAAVYAIRQTNTRSILLSEFHWKFS